MFRLNPRSRCNSSSRCCYRAREHVDPTWSRRITHGGESRPEMPLSPGSVGLARAHPLLITEPQAMEPSRQTRSSYGPPYRLGRWSSVSGGHRLPKPKTMSPSDKQSLMLLHTSLVTKPYLFISASFYAGTSEGVRLRGLIYAS